jgi:hypothetical protein
MVGLASGSTTRWLGATSFRLLGERFGHSVCASRRIQANAATARDGLRRRSSGLRLAA